MALGEECRSWITDRAVHWKIEIGQISWLLCLWEPNRLGIELLVSHLVVLGGSRPPGKLVELVVLCGSRPPGRLVGLWPREGCADPRLQVEVLNERLSTEKTEQTLLLLGWSGAQQVGYWGLGVLPGCPG